VSGSRPAEPARYLTLGQVVGAHGVRGGLRVNSFTDPPEALLKHREWHLLAANGQAREVRCTGGGEYRGQLRVELDGIDDRDVALALAGCWVQVLRESLPKPAEREYFRADLIGLTVQNDEGVVLGQISHFVDLPAAAVMVVRGEQEHWVPAQPPHLRRVDFESGLVFVDWPAQL